MDQTKIIKIAAASGSPNTSQKCLIENQPDKSNTRIVYYSAPKKDPAAAPKAPQPPPTKKAITATKKWSTITPADLLPDRQLELLLLARDHFLSGSSAEGAAPPHYTLIVNHIKQKLYSYRAQDLIKNKYCGVGSGADADATDIARVFELLVSCNMECHYCKKRVMLLYEYIREPLQWSLDRIDNSIGHTRNNLFIACLQCNLRRRCIKPERYELTKKCTNLVRLSGEIGAFQAPIPQDPVLKTPEPPAWVLRHQEN